MDTTARLSQFSTELHSHYGREQIPPLTLYHYTNTQGLLGILDKKGVFATHYQSLNDTGEVKYGRLLFDEILAEVFNSFDDSEPCLTLYERVNTAFSKGRIATDLFVSCFSEEEDNLHLWGYTGTNEGFAVGFNGHAIRRLQNEHFPLHEEKENELRYILRKVEYEVEAQRTHLISIFQPAFDILRSAPAAELGDEGVETLVQELAGLIFEFAALAIATFKQPTYKAEREWRLIYGFDVLDYTRHLLFRDGVYGLTSYVVLQLSAWQEAGYGPLDIVEIRHGPTRDPERLLGTMSKLIRKHAFHAKACGTTLPIRPR